MSLIYDLHSHSTASDGTLTPTQLFEHAAKQGVNVLALTDHDTLSGLSEAQQAADSLGVILRPGVEISVSWNGQTIHVVALGIDPNNKPLQDAMARMQTFRDWRAEEMAKRLQKRANIPGALEGAKEYAKGKLLSRTHFARFLLDNGYVTGMNEAFTRYLKQGRPGYVPGQWLELEETIGLITNAGGQAVVAHPARYSLTATKLRKFLGEFQECGGVGLEVVSGSHSRDEYFTMANVAKQFGFLASVGSDYHGPENPWVELGRLSPLPEGLVPIWQGWGMEADAS